MRKWTSGAQAARQTLWVAVTTLLTSLVIWPLLPTTKPSQSAPQAGSLLTDNSGAEQVRLELARLQAQNTALLTQVAALQGHVDSLPRSLTIAPESFTADHQQAIAQPQPLSLAEQEAAMAESAELVQQQFALIEEQFYGQSIDAQSDVQHWGALMQADLDLVDTRLRDLTGDSTAVRYFECRSSLCRAEFAHQGAQPSLLPALIATPHSSRISTHTAHTQEGAITVAIYHR